MTDSKPSPQKLREAADTLEAATGSMNWGASSPWRPWELRSLADKLEAQKTAVGTIAVSQEEDGSGTSIYIQKEGGVVFAVYVGSIAPKGFYTQTLGTGTVSEWGKVVHQP